MGKMYSVVTLFIGVSGGGGALGEAPRTRRPGKKRRKKKEKERWKEKEEEKEGKKETQW